MRRQLLAGMVGALLVLGTPATGAQERFIVVSSTTSTEQSGLFGHILPLFEKDTGIKIVWDTVPWPQMRQNFQRAMASSSGSYDVVMVINDWATDDTLAKLLPLEAMSPAIEDKDDIVADLEQGLAA